MSAIPLEEAAPVDYTMCDKCHKAYKAEPGTDHVCSEEEVMTAAQVKALREATNIFGYTGQELPSIFVPFVRATRLFYWYLAVPCCALFSVLALALYGHQFLHQNKVLPGQLCFGWFVIFTVICCAQCVIWVFTFIPARYSRANYNALTATIVGKVLRRQEFYSALARCQHALLFCVSIECLFLAVAQYALIDYGTLDQNFGLLMGVPCVIHLCVFLSRVLAWSQDTFESTFYIKWWDMPLSLKKKQPYYEYETSATFHSVAIYYGQADLLMGIFAVAVTYGLTEYTSETDKVYQFFETWHPCVLIDHYPASLAGMALIGVREIVGILFNAMLCIFVYCRAGAVEAIWSFGIIVIAQLLLTMILNAFSAQLYTEADLHTTIANWTGLSPEDLLNVRAHTLAYCIWMVGMIMLFVFQFRMTYRFNIPFGNGSLYVRVFWHVFFIVGLIFTVTMTAAMFVATNNLSMEWTRNPSSFIQTVIAFMFNKMQGKYLMLMVAPVQRQMFPPDLGILMRVTANPSRGRFGILGRSENVLSIAFWILGVLICGTYLIDDHIDSEITLFPLARGFRLKPAVFVFAPAWFLCSMLILAAVFLKVQEAAGSGASPFRELAIKVIGMAMWISALLCLFVTIPLWQQADYVTIALVVCFPLWFAAGQGFTPRCVLYIVCYIILTVLSSVKSLGSQGNVIASVLLLIQLIVYPLCFKRPDVRLYFHFEVLSQRRVVGHRQIQKEYAMVPIESGGAYAESTADYELAAAIKNQKANEQAEAKRQSGDNPESTHPSTP